MISHPIFYIYKCLSFKNGLIIWQIPDYSNIRHDFIDGINKYELLYSHAFYSIEFGYKLSACLHLNDTEYIAISIHFIQGEFDNDLPKTFSYKIRATLLNQKELGIKKDFIKEFEYSPPNKVNIDQIYAKQSECIYN